MARRRPKIVHLITRLDLGGAQQNTLYCVEHHDRDRFEVGLWTGEGGILDAKARAIERADVRILPWLVHPIAPARDAAAVARLAASKRKSEYVTIDAGGTPMRTWVATAPPR